MSEELEIRFSATTDVGRRRSANEDDFLTDEEHGVFAVADGMGGHRAGDVASATALQAVSEAASDGDIDLEAALRAANQAVFSKALANPEMRGMGTTVTAMKVVDGSALFAHVGDSRAYLLRDGDLTRITDDHSLVEELVREGRLTPDEAAVHPQRSIVTRALGVDESVDVDTYDVDLRAGDRILLCSDGLTSMVRDESIRTILRSQADPEQAAAALVEAANAAGGEDNITVLLLDVGGEDDVAEALAASRAVSAERTATGEWERQPDEPAAAPPPHSAAPTTRRWARIVVYAIPVVLVLAVVLGALTWYARSTYYVGIDEDRVALFQGVPEGFLFWDPTLEDATELDVEDLSQADVTNLEDGERFSSRSSAESFIRRLERKVESTTTTTKATTTTTERLRRTDGTR